jgi:hypothetical protein
MNPTCSKNPPTPRPRDGNTSGAKAIAGPNLNEAEICVKHEFMTLIMKGLGTCRGDGIAGAR